MRASLCSLLAAVLALVMFAAAPLQAEPVHGIAMHGAPALGPGYTHFPYANPDAPKGGVYHEAVIGSFDSLNPFIIKGQAAAALRTFVFESLMSRNLSEPFSLYGLIAKSVEMTPERDAITFHLDERAKFSDGTPVTAEDVLFSYELFREKGLPSFRAVLREQVESAEVLDDRRIHYVFMEDQPKRDLIQTVGGLPVFSKAHYEANGLDLEENSMTPFLGSGAYGPETLDVGKRSIYRRNPDYWGRDLPQNVGRHNFDTIRVEYFADYNVAFEGFKGGTYHFRDEASSKNWATSYDFPAVQDGYVVKAELDDGTIATGQSFVMNLRRPQFEDPRVREAIGLMFNFEWSNEQLFYGIYERINSVLENFRSRRRRPAVGGGTSPCWSR